MANRSKLKTMKRITVTVDSDGYAAFDRLARRGRGAVSWLIRGSMREFNDWHAEGGVVTVEIGEAPRRRQGGAAND